MNDSESLWELKKQLWEFGSNLSEDQVSKLKGNISEVAGIAANSEPKVRREAVDLLSELTAHPNDKLKKFAIDKYAPFKEKRDAELLSLKIFYNELIKNSRLNYAEKAERVDRIERIAKETDFDYLRQFGAGCLQKFHDSRPNDDASDYARRAFKRIKEV